MLIKYDVEKLIYERNRFSDSKTGAIPTVRRTRVDFTKFSSTETEELRKIRNYNFAIVM